MAKPPMWTTSLAHHDVHREDITLRTKACCPLSGPIARAGTPLGPSSEHDRFSSCGIRDLKVASRTSRATLLALQVSAEQSAGWMTAMPSLPPIRPTALRSGRREAAKTLTDDCSALYWTQELGLTGLESGRRAASNEPSCFSRC